MKTNRYVKAENLKFLKSEHFYVQTWDFKPAHSEKKILLNHEKLFLNIEIFGSKFNKLKVLKYCFMANMKYISGFEINSTSLFQSCMLFLT